LKYLLVLNLRACSVEDEPTTSEVLSRIGFALSLVALVVGGLGLILFFAGGFLSIGGDDLSNWVIQGPIQDLWEGGTSVFLPCAGLAVGGWLGSLFFGWLEKVPERRLHRQETQARQQRMWKAIPGALEWVVKKQEESTPLIKKLGWGFRELEHVLRTGQRLDVFEAEDLVKQLRAEGYVCLKSEEGLRLELTERGSKVLRGQEAAFPPSRIRSWRERCWACGGKGYTATWMSAGMRAPKCRKCNGRGSISLEPAAYVERATPGPQVGGKKCTACGGRGYSVDISGPGVGATPCPKCGGGGHMGSAPTGEKG
jgi:hypothetical protein